MKDMTIDFGKYETQTLSSLCVDILAERRINRDKYKDIATFILDKITGNDEDTLEGQNNKSFVNTYEKITNIKVDNFVAPLKLSYDDKIPESFESILYFKDIKKEYNLSVADDEMCLINGSKGQLGIKFTTSENDIKTMFIAREDTDIILDILNNIISSDFYNANGEYPNVDIDSRVNFSYINNKANKAYSGVVVPRLTSLSTIPVHKCAFLWDSVKSSSNTGSFYIVKNSHYLDGRNHTTIQKNKNGSCENVVLFENIRLVKIMRNFISFAKQGD